MEQEGEVQIMPKQSSWVSAGALLPAGAAFLSASCCLPLGLGVLGLGSATLSQFVSLRPYFLGLTMVLLGVAFYQAYRPNPHGVACESDTVCAQPVRRTRQRIFLWIIALVSLALATLPYWINRLIYWAAVLED